MNRYRVTYCTGRLIKEFLLANEPFSHEDVRKKSDDFGLTRTQDVSAHTAADACTVVKVHHRIDSTDAGALVPQMIGVVVLDVECLES